MSSRSARVADGLGTVPDHPTLLPASLLADPDVDTGPGARTTRDWIVDTLCFLLAVGSGVLVYFILGIQGRLPPMPLQAVDVAVGAAGSVALWWRRRWPVTLAVLLGLAGVAFATGVGAGSIALFTVAVHRRFTVVAPVAILTMLNALPYSMLYPDPTNPFWVTVAGQCLTVTAIVAWGMFVRARRQLVVSLRDRAHRAEAEQQLRADQARHAERTRIAREMHDVLAHRISLLSTYAGALEYRRNPSPKEVARAAGIIREGAHQALQDLREVIGVLREDPNGDRPERPQPTLADLAELVEESRRAGMRVLWESRVDDPDTAPAAAGRDAYRIVQEGLTNARKHAPGTTVTVTIDGAAGAGLTVEVRNRLPVGRAIDPGDPVIPGTGSGLVGLAERANVSGGRLEHGRTADGGFRLRAWLPWPA